MELVSDVVGRQANFLAASGLQIVTNSDGVAGT
jgi:hypothetical protein